jgi:cyclopropane fatty-acyl-phospholipid synthase-like methyltransferase
LLSAVACQRTAANDVATQHDRYRQPERIVAGLALAPGMRVADVGAGRGYLTTRIAAAVGSSGRVVATDIDRAALVAIPRAPARSAPIETRVVKRDDCGLEPGAYNRILMAEVDQYVPDRVDYLRQLARALAPDGFIAVSNRLTYRAPLVDAATRAGLRVTEEPLALPAQFFVRLEGAR